MKTLDNYICESKIEKNVVVEAEDHIFPKPKDFNALMKECKKNALFKAIEKKCKQAGYVLVDAHIDMYGSDSKIPSFCIQPPTGERFAPNLRIEIKKGAYEVQICTSSYGCLGGKDIEAWVSWCQKAAKLVAWMNAQDLTKLPTAAWEKE